MTRHRNQHTTRAAATPPVAALADRACADADPEIFFPPSGRDSANEAREVCGRCPHREACLDWALDTEQLFGVWGGTTPDERYAMLRGAA